MINFLLGQPGGGKSYEATVFHVLPALAQGRKIITNLPLDLERLAQIDATYPALIELRHDSKEVEQPVKLPFGRVSSAQKELVKVRPFAHISDYGDTWRHPEKGFGCLYVIDECHLSLPRGQTSIEVEEWFSLHRHEFADVLLISQSYGKVSKAICDLVQVVYRVKKATAFGTSNKYIRKVQDGLRGEVVNTSFRSYEKKFFGLYKSHTRSGAGAELAANDIVPIWKRWPVIGAGLCFLIVVALLSTSKTKVNPISNAVAASGQIVASPAVPPPELTKPAATSANALPAGAEAFTTGKLDKHHPYERLEFHIVASVSSSTRIYYRFELTQSGQHAFYMSGDDLIQSGYLVTPVSDCSVKIRYGDFETFAVCDLARQTLVSNVGAVGGSGVQ